MARTPLHARVTARLRGRIHDRELTPGELLPSESALQEEFSVSRSVVRQALATLEAEGLVRRAQGRGTVVAPQTELHRDVEMSSGLMDQLQGAGSTTSTTVLRFEPADVPQYADLLGPDVHVLERLRRVDGRPVAFIRTYLPASVATAIDAAALEDGSLHQLVRAATGRGVAAGSRTIRAVAAGTPLAEALGVDERDPLLLLEGTSRDQRGEVVEVFSTWHRSDLVAFDVGLRPELPAAAGEGTDAGALDRVGQLLEQTLAEVAALRRGR
ncbi:GntR family transcriptional regulator [Nocardioides lentus]|uniref:GntR family transcriptional regulator n=1 Tax=Nocardioides lentus TaxID=338077 RepID=A0ABP5B2Q9_9ACTN